MKLHCLALLVLCSSSTFSQNSYRELFGDSIKEMIWSCGIAYLPSANSEYTILKAKPTKLVTKHYEYKIRKFYKRKQRHNINISKKEFVKIHQLYTSLCQPVVNFALSKEDKDSLRSFLKDTTYYGAPLYKLSSDQLEKYLEKDSIYMDMSVFEIDSLNGILHRMVIDGAPFRFRMMNVSLDNDTIVYKYDGNLVGGDRYKDLSKYIIFNRLNTESDLYKYLPLDDYFSQSNFLQVILRYIEGNEGLLEFKPLELFIED